MMNIEKTHVWIGLIANISVIAGIIFLAIELNQNSNMMAAQTRSAITEEIMHIMEQQGDPAYSEALLQYEAGERISPEQSRILGSVASQTFRHWENVYFQYERGLFNESEFAGLRAYMKNYIQDTFAQDMWLAQKPFYSEGFQEFIAALAEK